MAAVRAAKVATRVVETRAAAKAAAASAAARAAPVEASTAVLQDLAAAHEAVGVAGWAA